MKGVQYIDSTIINLLFVPWKVFWVRFVLSHRPDFQVGWFLSYLRLS